MDFFASERHFLDHIAPMALAMGGDARVFVGAGLESYARKLGLRPSAGRIRGTVVVASIGDYNKMRDKKIIFVEHGVGMSYGGGHPSYSGGRNRDAIVLYLATNQTVADRQSDRYPDQDVRVVGCPKMDKWFNGRALGRESKRIAFSFHWDCSVVPETRSAFPFYKDILPEVAEQYDLIGHGHPRDWIKLSQEWGKIGVTRMREFDNVMTMADVYVTDNSSTMYEFAATGRPVVALNAPWYRRDVSHGLRFWDDVPGMQVNEPGEIFDALDASLVDSDFWKARRKEITEKLYPNQGFATKVAVDCISEYD